MSLQHINDLVNEINLDSEINLLKQSEEDVEMQIQKLTNIKEVIKEYENVYYHSLHNDGKYELLNVSIVRVVQESF